MPRESTIKIQRSVTAAATPSGLTAGELAVNLVDRKLFVGGTAGSNITFLDASAVVTSFNGLTGAVAGITAGGANTFTALNSFSAGLSAAGGVTFSGTFSGATASFSKLLSASAGVSASALTVTTTGDEEKTSEIIMASGVTAVTSVESLITLCSYDTTTFARQASIGSNIVAGYDLKIKGSGDTSIQLNDNTISIGDVNGDFFGTQITFDNTEYVTVNGKLKPDQLVWEWGGAGFIPNNPSEHPIYIRHSDGADPPVYDYPFYVSLQGSVISSAVETPLLYADSIVPLTSQPGTLGINCSSDGSGGGSSITHIGDLVGDNLNTYLTVDDTVGNVDISAASGQINLYGAVVAAATISIGSGLGLLNSTSTALGTTAANQTITQVVFSTAHRSAEFFVQASTEGGAYEALKIMVVHDGTTTYNTQYGVVRSGATLGTYTTTLATVGGGGGSRIRLRVTPTAVNTTYKTMITALPV